jgi:hypothetical protein
MKNECAINAFQMGMFEKIVADIPEGDLRQPAAGHGHTPLWLIGHLALTGGMGCQLLGVAADVPSGWAEAFGPRTPDPVMAEPSGLSKPVLTAAMQANYAALRTAYEDASPEVLARPHGVPFFLNSPITTVNHLVAVLLTNHFGFHLAQLSSVRRELGKSPLV